MVLWKRWEKPALKPEEEQAAKLARVGARLRQKREAQGMSLDEVCTVTHIRVSQLKAIEEGNLSKLPEPIYLQGLVRRFADALGDNGEQVAGTFSLGGTPRPRRGTWLTLPAARLHPLHLYLTYILLIGLSVHSLSLLLLYQNNIPRAPLPIPSVAAPSPRPSVATSNSIQVHVVLRQPSWIQVLRDGKPVFAGVMPQGSQATWTAQEKLSMRAGNAGGVWVSINNQKPYLLGPLGTVRQLTVVAPKSARSPRPAKGP